MATSPVQVGALDRLGDHVPPQTPGQGKLGLLVKAMTIRVLGRGCAFAVSYPAPFEGDLCDAARRHVITRLGRHWGRVGFKHFKDGVWILDLAARAFATRSGGSASG